MIDLKKIETIFTHSGIFHGDDVVAVTVLGRLCPEAEIVRTRNVRLIKEAAEAGTGVAADVGGENSPYIKDHHQRGFEEARENGVKYAAAGLVWKDFGRSYIISIADEIGVTLSEAEVEEVWSKIDAEVISGVDAIDTRQFNAVQYLDTDGSEVPVGVISLSQIISQFNPIAGLGDDLEENFLRAVEFAGTYLRRKTALEVLNTDAGVANLLGESEFAADGKVVMMPEFSFGWKKWAIANHPEVLIGVYQAVDGNWQAHWVPESPMSKVLKGNGCPEAWRGLAGPKLVEATGNDQAVFCHAAGFMIVARSREAVVELATAMLASK